MNTFKKALSIAVVAHFVVFTYASVFADSDTSKPHKAGVVDESYIETERVHSISVSEKQIQQELTEFTAIKQKNEAKEADAQKRLSDLNARELKLKKSISSADLKLNKINLSVKARAKELSQLKDSQVAKAKKLKEEKLALLAEKKDAEQKLLKSEALARKVAQAKEANALLLSNVRKENKRTEARKLAKVRGSYEKGIHDALMSNWQLPYMRSRASCKVEISLSAQGLIETYRIIPPCDPIYIRSIHRAVTKTAMVPRAPEKVFQSKEIVNFIDNTNGIFVR